MHKINELCANTTHTETSYTVASMNKLLNEAENQILSSCSASKE